MPAMRLNRALALAAGIARRRADAEIRDGRVLLNGRRETNPAVSFDPAVDRLKWRGREVRIRTVRSYYAVNKPVGVLSTASDDRGRPTVMDLVPRERGLYPVGRLDADTRGLILVTNDGELCHRLAHPSFEVWKRYEVALERDLEEGECEAVASGRIRGGGKRAPVAFRRLGRHRYEIVLAEGAKRQIRAIFATLRATVKDLKRTAIGPVRMGKVPEGGYRPLGLAEVRRLRALAGLPPDGDAAEGGGGEA